MDETGNVFDVSTTLIETDDLPEEESGPPLEETPPHREAAGAEPDYFEVKPRKQADFRRRAVAALGVVAGLIGVITMISAATGSAGTSGSGSEPSTAAAPRPADSRQGDESTDLTVSGPPQPREHEPAAKPGRPATRSPRKAGGNDRAARASEPHKSSAPRHPRAHHHHDAPPSPEPTYTAEPESTYTPEPEPVYTPEPEATYVPPAPEPAPAPAPSPPASGGSGQEFGIER